MWPHHPKIYKSYKEQGTITAERAN
jgi:hypothetical protein